MALQIKNNKGILEIEGDLNAQNSNSLKNYFNEVIQQSNFITLSLNKITTIDKPAFNTIISLYKNALSKNKVFYIIGKENKKVSNIFAAENANFLLKSTIA